MGQNKSQISLKWQLLFIIILCWILPVILLITVTGTLLNRNIYDQVSGMVVNSVESATDIVVVKIEELINESLSGSYIPTMKKAWQNYVQSGVEYDLYKTVDSFMRDQYRNSKKIRFSAVQFINDPKYIIYSYDVNRASYEDQMFYTQKVAPIVAELSDTLGSEIRFINVDDHVYLIRSLVDDRLQTYAMLSLEIDKDAVFAPMKKMQWCTDVEVVINGCTSLSYGEIHELHKTNIGKMQTTHSMNVNKGKLLVYGAKSSNRFELTFRARADLMPLLAQNEHMKYILYGVVGLFIPLLIIVTLFFYSKVSGPIESLVRISRKIEEGELGATVNEIVGSREMNYLSRRFNAMSTKLKYQFDHIFKEEIALRDARIMALESQINPHFLGNTLEVINWEARIEGNVKVCQMLEALSTLLEAAANRKRVTKIHLSEELMYVNAYLVIIAERLGKRLTVVRDIDESLLDVYVPRLILQPLLENAVEHGVANKPYGQIDIRIYKKESDFMIMEVENNAPLTAEEQEKIEQLLADVPPEGGMPSTSLGIRNVHQRIRIMYGEECGLTVGMNKKGNTVSSICVKVTETQQ